MQIPPPLHRWNVTPKRAVEIQRDLAPRVISRTRRRTWRWIAGTDLAFSPDGSSCIAGAVIWDMEAKRIVEQRTAMRPVRFPYVPGLLSFREVPALLAALRKLKREPDVVMLDGQGLAHPRRCGLACHVGVLLNRPTVGCAKSRLIGEYGSIGKKRGSWTPLNDGSERIGAVVRTPRLYSTCLREHRP